MVERDIDWMQQALALAEQAKTRGEVPVGAVLVLDGALVASGYNQPISSCDPTAHAEILVLRDAAKKLGNYRLVDTTLYVTLEPCMMCVGAIIHARIKRLVFGAYDPKSGAVQSCGVYLATWHHNHAVEYSGGVLAEPCGQLLKTFFRDRR